MLLESHLIYLDFAIATTELESELQGSVLIKQDYYLYRPWSKAEDYNFRYKQHEQTNCSKAEFLLVIAFSKSKKKKKRRKLHDILAKVSASRMFVSGITSQSCVDASLKM